MPASDNGGATPLNVNDWMQVSDYPNEAVRRGQQGYVTVRYTITAEGRVSDCGVTRSSGFPLLDAVPCRLLRSRARFRPALDENGSPRATTATTSMQFWLPDGN